MLPKLFPKNNRELRLQRKQEQQAEISEQLKISEAVKTYVNPQDEKYLSKIAKTDEKIYQKLSEIEKNQIDEQNTSIRKTSDLYGAKISPLVSDQKKLTDNALNNVKEDQKNNVGLLDLISGAITKIIGPASLLFLGGLLAIGMKPFELLSDIFKNGIKVIAGLSDVIADITTSVIKSVSAMIDPIIKYIKDLIPDFNNPFSSVDKAADITDKYNSDAEKARKTKAGLDDIEKIKPTDKADDVAKVTEKVIGKETVSTLKSVVKKIPIIGLLAGIGFGISRAMDGDTVGAGLEVASGAASIVPGWGTAASLAIDAGLIARDYTMPFAKMDSSSGPADDSAITGKYVSDLARHNVDDSLVQMIKQNEGFSSKYYKDAHGMSIGYGHFSKGDGSVPVSQILGYEPKNGEISREEAEILLKYDISKAQNGLFSRFPWVKEQPKSVQNNLTDMTYNLGLGGISGFKETLEYIKNKQYTEAAKNLTETKWYTQVGNRAKNIVSDFKQLGDTTVASKGSTENTEVIPNKEPKENKIMTNVNSINQNSKNTPQVVTQTMTSNPKSTLAGSIGSTPDYSKTDETTILGAFNN